MKMVERAAVIRNFRTTALAALEAQKEEER